jgi:hypothetical protein
MTDPLRGLIDEGVLAFAPLVAAAQDEQAMLGLLKDLGWEPASVPRPLADLATAGDDLLNLVGAGPDADEAQIFAAIGKLVDAVEAIRSQGDDVFPAGIDIDAFKTTIGRDLLEYLLVEHLLTNRHRIGGALRLAGIIRLLDTPAVGLRQRFLKRTIAWNEIGDLVTDPAKGFRDAFDWTTSAPNLETAVGVLGSLLESNGFVFSYLQLDGNLLAFAHAGATTPPAQAIGIDVSLDLPSGVAADLAAGVQLLVRPATATRNAAIALLPYANLSGAKEIALSDSLTLTINEEVDFTKGVAATFSPGQPIVLESGFLGGTASSPAKISLGLRLSRTASEPETVLFGSGGGSRLSVSSVTFTAGAALLTPEQIDAFVELAFSNANIVVQPDPGATDSFLSTFLPAGGISARLSFAARLSSATGFHLSGSTNLQAAFPINLQIGPITVQAVSIAIKPATGGLGIEIGVAIAGSIGPLDIVFDRVGFDLVGNFVDPPTGNLGPIGLSTDFLGPDGIGLSVDASGVLTGGGFIYRNEAEGVYAGALQLSLHEEMTLTAFGLIATRMPDGTPGYSVVIFITAEGFQPIPLGLGFTLQAIGGVVAINRTFDSDVLAQGMKNDTLKSLLFPANPVGNAPAIVRSLAAVFPAKRGSYLLGVLARIGWFTPTLVLMDLALILEFGVRKRLIVLGRISALLPSPDNDLIRLVLDAVGVVDFDQGTASIDAMLVDSRLAHKFPLTGAMALRARWSSGADFVLAVGGVNPNFTPPEPLPALPRVAITLSSGENPRLTCQAYFAITPNTVQFGSQTELYAAAYGFSIQGDVGFDVLLQIAPLHFIADYHASVQLKHGSSNMFKVSVAGELEGPRPLRVSGKASFEILWCDFSVSFDKTLVEGEAPPLPQAIDVTALLKQALSQPQSWTAERAPGRTQGVALRSLPPSEALILDPLGTLRVKQQVAPLDTARDINLFGGAPVTGARRFHLAATLNGRPQPTTPIDDQFAPAHFFAMSDDEKLAAPPFETMGAGLMFGDDTASFDASEIVPAPLEYTEIVIDAAQPAQPAGRYQLPVGRLQDLARSGAAARAPIRTEGLARFRSRTAAPAATLQPVIWTIQPLGDGAPPGLDPSVSTWTEHLAALDALNRGATSFQIVPEYELAA